MSIACWAEIPCVAMNAANDSAVVDRLEVVVILHGSVFSRLPDLLILGIVITGTSIW